MLKLKLIVGSIREGRSADLVTPWLIERLEQRADFELEVLDLRDWPLPLFAETLATLGDFRDPTYSVPMVRQWNQRIKDGEAFVFLTPEYNHSIPGLLKNAIDSVFASNGFRNKPAAFVSYSGGLAAGVRAIEHLAHVMIEMDAVPLRNTVPVANVYTAFEGRAPRDPATDVALDIMLDDLGWHGAALQRARADGELPPGYYRMQAAMGART